MRTIGVVGPTGAGKSVVLRMLAALGAVTIEADDLSRELLGPRAPLTERIRAEFGDGYVRPDGSLKRSELAALIFSDETARVRLNAIMYPAMLDLLETRLAALRASDPAPALVAVEAANLLEMGADRCVDAIVLVDADPATRRKRLEGRDGLDTASAQERIEAQSAAGLDHPRADFSIRNDGEEGPLRSRVEKLLRQLVDG
jgi:dephospho-CoA kinase